MSEYRTGDASRRDFLKMTAMAGLAGTGGLALEAAAQ